MNYFFKYFILCFLALNFLSCSHFKNIFQSKDKTETTVHNNLTAKKKAIVARDITVKKKTIPTGKQSYIVGASTKDSPSPLYYLKGADHLNLDINYFDIPVVYNKSVARWIKFFTKNGKRSFIALGRRAAKYAPVMGEILESEGMPRDLIFVAMAESGFNNKAKSWAKAMGPWQFMKFTGKKFGLDVNWYLDERRDPLKATVAAASYLKFLYGRYKSWELAFAGYNAGEGKVDRAIKRYKTKDFWKLIKGRYLRPETKNYVPKIMALAIIGKNLEAFGLEKVDFSNPLNFEEITVGPGTDLFKVAKSLKIEFRELHDLNPEIMRWFTPLKSKDYILRIPTGKKELWKDCCSESNVAAVAFQKYQIRGNGSRLSDVARKLKIKRSYVLEDLNGFSSKKKLKKGKYVLIPFRKGQSRRARMYADLYELPRKRKRRKRTYRKRVHLAKRRGKKISNPRSWYTVSKGDSLWSVARKTGISLDTLIASNLHIIQHRMIREGDRLAVK